MNFALSRSLFLFLLGLVPSLWSYGQDDLKFSHLTSEQGLSHNSVWSICQDREGFMWFGTLDGLNRYDGYTFKVFRADPRDPDHTLQHNIISAIHEDRVGRLWVVTLGGGLHEVDKRTGNVTPYRIDPKRVNLWNVMVSIYEDRQGILWLGAGKGIARFDPRTKQFTLYQNPSETMTTYVDEDAAGQFWATDRRNVLRFDHQTGKYTAYPINHPNQSYQLPFYVASDGLAWVGTYGSGLFRMDTRKPGQFTPYQPTNGTINKFISQNGLYETGEYLWVATNEGLQRITKRTAQVVTYQANPDLPNRLTGNIIQAIYWDRSGTLWVGTTNGLNKVVAHQKRFDAYQLAPTLPGLRRNENSISAVLKDHIGRLWVGSAGDMVQGDFQNGLIRYDTKRKQAEPIQANPANPKALSSNNVAALREDRTGQLWVGTSEGLHRYNPTNATFTRYPSKVAVKSIAEDPSGNLWIAGYPAGNQRVAGIASFNSSTGQYVNYFVDPKNPKGLVDDNIVGLFASRTGLIYVATGGDGINRLDPKTGKFTKYLPDYVSPEGHLNDKEIHNFYEDPDGIIWLGTRLGGLHRFDPKTERFTYFTTQDGLANNSVNSIIGDDSGTLWIGTDQGLSRFDPRTKRFRNYDISDGLPDNGFRINSVSKRGKKLLFGTVNGFVEFYPDSIRDNTTPPPVYVSGFSVLGEPRPIPNGSVELPYNENFLSFEFVALNYNAPEKNQYAYQLVGVDKHWVQTGTRRYASYTELRPGTYTFRVKASNNDGIWNEKGTSLLVVIHPPWWRTWWAYGFYGLCLLAGLWAFNRYQRRRLIEAEQQKARERELAQAREIERANTELRTTLDHLKTTQSQLIQKEKMASLGELTAGIAHEIQNPLNFVNNFSEVSSELVSELEEEAQVGNMEEVKAIAGDLRQNLQKITHHGTRASSIVKGMLEHSRTATGERQPTDLNALCEECLRLAYHGFRAKDKEFNAELKIDFDPHLGPVEVVSQEIGRVLLNLFNNAFYAVQQKQNQQPTNYKATVSLSTRQENGQVEIHIKDNGMGIPETVKPKIFQPFFTTKPTGEGTGLGLSLSYDIVTKGHGGSLLVESQAGQGTEFVVQLPTKI